MKVIFLMKNYRSLWAKSTTNYLLPALLFLLLTACVTAQTTPPPPPDPALLESLFTQGIELQDKGDAREAIKIFDQLLALNPKHVPALSEKSYALMVLHRYRPVLDLTAKVLKDHPGSDKLLFIYLNRGNAFAYLNQPAEALKVFDEGLAAFPQANLLYFNKGLTLAEQGRKAEAEWNFQKAIVEAPDEPSAHLALGHLALSNNQRIPALLAFSRFLILEPEGKRAKSTVREVKKLLVGKADPPETTATDTAKSSLNHFGKVELSIADTPPAAKKPASKPQTAKKKTTGKSTGKASAGKASPAIPAPTLSSPEKFEKRFEKVCNALSKHMQGGTGFYWTFYAPYFVEMQDLNLLKPFSKVAFVSEDDAGNDAWLKENKNELGRFFSWSEIYPWNKTLPAGPPISSKEK